MTEPRTADLRRLGASDLHIAPLVLGGNVFGNFLENIEPWCISRQIRWGHRIPSQVNRSMISRGSTPLPSDLLILRPCLSRISPWR